MRSGWVQALVWIVSQQKFICWHSGLNPVVSALREALFSVLTVRFLSLWERACLRLMWFLLEDPRVETVPRQIQTLTMLSFWTTLWLAIIFFNVPIQCTILKEISNICRKVCSIIFLPFFIKQFWASWTFYSLFLAQIFSQYYYSIFFLWVCNPVRPIPTLFFLSFYFFAVDYLLQRFWKSLRESRCDSWLLFRALGSQIPGVLFKELKKQIQTAIKKKRMREFI